MCSSDMCVLISYLRLFLMFFGVPTGGRLGRGAVRRFSCFDLVKYNCLVKFNCLTGFRSHTPKFFDLFFFY